MVHRAVLAVLLLFGATAAAAPSVADAALSARPELMTRDGATRLVVTISSTRAFTARTRPRAVMVLAGGQRLVLRPRSAKIWATPQRRGSRARALLALAGTRIAIQVRTRARTTRLRRRLPATAPGVPTVAQPPPRAIRPPAPAPSQPVAPTAPKGEQALAVALQYLGTPYRWGGASPATGFDAAGLVQWSYAQVGIALERVVDQQFTAGTPATEEALQLGDLVFFRDPTGYVHHVGMAAGAGRFIHAPHTGDVVKLSSLDEPYYRQQFAGARRIGG